MPNRSKGIKNDKESQGQQGKRQESLEEEVRRLLDERTPWNEISKRLHVSTKTIQKIRTGEYGKESKRTTADTQEALDVYGALPPKWVGKTQGEIASVVFRLFQRDVKPFAVVKRLLLPPDLVKRLFEDFKAMSEHDNTFCRICDEAGYERGYNECLAENERHTHILSWLVQNAVRT
jgi:hypothetical protein